MDSRSLHEDVTNQEVVCMRLITTATGVWAICRVVNPHATLGDLFRAYPPQNLSNKVGLVCCNADDEQEVVEMARRWV